MRLASVTIAIELVDRCVALVACGDGEVRGHLQHRPGRKGTVIINIDPFIIA